MINPRDDCPHAYKLSPHFSEQIPSQEIPVENQSALQVMPHAAARFAGKLVTTGKDRRRRQHDRPAAQGTAWLAADGL
jgi:hypothetical protein